MWNPGRYPNWDIFRTCQPVYVSSNSFKIIILIHFSLFYFTSTYLLSMICICNSTDAGFPESISFRRPKNTFDDATENWVWSYHHGLGKLLSWGALALLYRQCYASWLEYCWLLFMLLLLHMFNWRWARRCCWNRWIEIRQTEIPSRPPRRRAVGFWGLWTRNWSYLDGTSWESVDVIWCFFLICLIFIYLSTAYTLLGLISQWILPIAWLMKDMFT